MGHVPIQFCRTEVETFWIAKFMKLYIWGSRCWEGGQSGPAAVRNRQWGQVARRPVPTARRAQLRPSVIFLPPNISSFSTRIYSGRKVRSRCGHSTCLGAPGGEAKGVSFIKSPSARKRSIYFTPPHSSSYFSTFLHRVIQYGGQCPILVLGTGISTAALCVS